MRTPTIVAAIAMLGMASVFAAEVGQVKVTQGKVLIERGKQQLPATVGTRIHTPASIMSVRGTEFVVSVAQAPGGPAQPTSAPVVSVP